MAGSDRLSDLIPKPLLDIIRDRIKAGITDAEAQFQINEDEEDAITGALGQAISTPQSLTYQGSEGVFTYGISSKKIRGRGPGAPEKRLGADAIFQVIVSKQGKQLFAKGLPFQAKKGGGFKNVAVRRQAAALLRTSGTGIVLRYSKNGYSGLDVRDIVRSQEPSTVAIELAPKKLARILGDDFLDCKIGRLNFSFLPEAETWDETGIWVISTNIVAAIDREPPKMLPSDE